MFERAALAATRIRVGSHLDVPNVLEAAGEEGALYDEVVARLPRLDQRPLAFATGSAGDVYLCHPFLVHAASWPHRGRAPRVIAQPPPSPEGELELERADGDYSPVELAVRIGLGLSLSTPSPISATSDPPDPASRRPAG